MDVSESEHSPTNFIRLLLGAGLALVQFFLPKMLKFSIKLMGTEEEGVASDEFSLHNLMKTSQP